MTSNPPLGQLFTLPFDQPLTDDGKVLAATAAGNAFRMFYLTNSTTQVTVYQDAALQTPYAAGPVFANSSGQFPPIYLSPAYEYRSQLFDGNGRLLDDTDPVNNNAAGPLYVSGIMHAAFKAATTARSAVSLLSDPDLSIAIPGAGTYRVDMDLVFTASAGGATPGLQLEAAYSGNVGTGTLSGTGFSNTYVLAIYGGLNGVIFPNTGTSSASNLTVTNPANALATVFSLGTTASTNVIRVSGTFQALTGGTFSLKWSPNGAGTVSLLTGSALTIQQVA